MASRCPQTDFDLLVGTLKPFAQIASFYAISKHPAAVEVRESLGSTDKFYEKLFMELDGLRTHLSKVGPAAATKTLARKEIAGGLPPVLDVLDKTISNKLHEVCFSQAPPRPKTTRC
jgi:hypothetical protein